MYLIDDARYVPEGNPLITDIMVSNEERDFVIALIVSGWRVVHKDGDILTLSRRDNYA